MRCIPILGMLTRKHASCYVSDVYQRPRQLDSGSGQRKARILLCYQTILTNLVDRIMAFVLLLSEDKTHLPDLYSFHDFMTTFFLARHDQELAALQKEHRPGRAKSKRLAELENLIASEKREYHDGIDVPDLCDEINVGLLRQWEGDPQALPLFRFVRISGQYRDTCRVIQHGTHKLLQNDKGRSSNDESH